MADKAAVLFPGIGYNFDRPLLHFGREQAIQHGCEVIPVPYANFPQHVRGDRRKMQEALDTAEEQAETILQNTDWKAYGSIIFLSKSIGTVAAADYAYHHHLKADQIFFTPFPETFAVPVSGRAIAFHAQEDPWMEDQAVISAARRAGVPMTIYPHGNHSLETGDTLEDIRILEDVFRKTEMLFRGF